MNSHLVHPRTHLVHPRTASQQLTPWPTRIFSAKCSQRMNQLIEVLPLFSGSNFAADPSHLHFSKSQETNTHWHTHKQKQQLAQLSFSAFPNIPFLVLEVMPHSKYSSSFDFQGLRNYYIQLEQSSPPLSPAISLLTSFLNFLFLLSLLTPHWKLNPLFFFYSKSVS